jgi:DNA repair exonuclease SbcCD ATPase subunit
LRELRYQIAEEGSALATASTKLASATSICERFTLLDLKYSSDLARLGATDEGIAYFQVLEETTCPLCGTPVEQHLDPGDLAPRAPTKYRDAIAAEAEKIRTLRRGLQASVAHEKARIATATADVQRLTASLKVLEEKEQFVLQAAGEEFDDDPRELAESHTRFSSWIDAFDEIDRLKKEIARLEQETKQKRTALVRNIGSHGD